MTDNNNIMIGRQPIYNANLGVFAYELLFRSADESSKGISGDEATSQVVINTFLEMGLDNLVGTRHACINLGENHLLWENIPRIMPERVILDLPRNLRTSDDAIQSVEKLKQSGFTLAINDFSDTPQYEVLIDYIDIIRIDVKSLKYEETRKHLQGMQRYKKIMLAERIEELDDYELYTELGFNYFQGYFLSHPKIVRGHSISNNRLSVLNLIAAINRPGMDVIELENIINKDIALSYKLLKLVNSALFGLSSKVESIRHCIVLLGRRQLVSWVTLMALGSMDDRPREMLQLSMVRARTCELMAEATQHRNRECFFTVGLLSALDILMQQPLAGILKHLPLSRDIQLALLKRQGDMGEALNSAIAFELSEWDKVKYKSLSRMEMVKINLQAFKWANEICRTLREG